ncbi:MAG: hypothetical protein ABJF11_19120 [Reichenbachiella sp.]|uniref:Vgb family protein n=1 Tax=Reichenbachiella sp. TaxID=2184521 RepID=UPI003266BF51
MNMLRPLYLLLIICATGSCSSENTEPVPDDVVVFDACDNPTTEGVNDKRCLYTVSTLTESFNGSGGLTVDENDFIYVADFGSVINNADGEIVSKIDPETGEVTEFAIGLKGPSGNAFAKNGNLIQANIQGNFVSEITPEGVVSTISDEGLISPVGVVLDEDQNIYVCNCGGNSIQKINQNGASTVFVSDPALNCPNGATIDTDGNIYVANFNNSSIIKIAPDASLEVFATLPGNNNSHLVFGNGVIYALSRGNDRLYEVTLDGEISVIAGNDEIGNVDGSGEEATFFIPNGIGISNDGSKIYVVSRLVGVGTPLNPVVVRVIEKK